MIHEYTIHENTSDNYDDGNKILNHGSNTDNKDINETAPKRMIIK